MASAAVWNEPPEQDRPGPCAECKRLRVQARAAVLTGDDNRLANVKAQIAEHRAEVHGQAAA